MLLNSWKDIAKYLNCGLRTAQRWEADLKMPVTRVRPGKRGPVLSDTDHLDRWIRTRGANIAANELPALRQRTIEEGQRLFRTELNIAAQMAQLSVSSLNPDMAERRRRAARRACESVEKHLLANRTFTREDLNLFQTKLQNLKAHLQRMGV